MALKNIREENAGGQVNSNRTKTFRVQRTQRKWAPPGGEIGERKKTSKRGAGEWTNSKSGYVLKIFVL